jgi:hypothetical protein
VSKANETSSLEREIEEARQHLATTIDQLLYRSHPKTIASRQIATIKAHFVDEQTGQPRTDNILRTVGGVVGVLTVLVLIRKVVR